jgi:predicted phosphodiesterase
MKLPLGGFVLALGGDLLSGNIHEELRENNEAPILVSVINLANLLATVIEKIQKELKVHMFIPMVIGNHGRLDKKPRMKNKAEDNYEYILFHMIAKHFVNNKNITCHIPSSADAYYTIYDTKFCLTHGDSFKGGNGIAGIFSPIMRGDLKKRHVQQAVQNPYDVLLIGHFHQLITTKSLIVNGSVKGYDEYAYNMNFGYEDPQQALFLTHPLYGNYAQFAINGIDKSKNPRKNKDRISIIK